jgi:uncharacterized protein
VTLRIHILNSNVDAMPDLVTDINDAFAEDRRFSVAFTPIERLGGPIDNELPVMSSSERASSIRELTSLLRYPEQEAGHDDTAAPYVCYAARPNSLAIRADGTIAKCTVALRDPQNSIGRLERDGSVTVDKSKFRYWIRGLASMNEQELSCPWSH